MSPKYLQILLLAFLYYEIEASDQPVYKLYEKILGGDFGLYAQVPSSLSFSAALPNSSLILYMYFKPIILLSPCR